MTNNIWQKNKKQQLIISLGSVTRSELTNGPLAWQIVPSMVLATNTLTQDKQGISVLADAHVNAAPQIVAH